MICIFLLPNFQTINFWRWVFFVFCHFFSCETCNSAANESLTSPNLFFVFLALFFSEICFLLVDNIIKRIKYISRGGFSTILHVYKVVMMVSRSFHFFSIGFFRCFLYYAVIQRTDIRLRVCWATLTTENSGPLL